MFVYYDNETDKSINYNPNKNNLEEIVQKINVTNGIKGLKKGNMQLNIFFFLHIINIVIMGTIYVNRVYNISFFKAFII